MLGRKLFSIGPVASLLTIVALVGGCREATTGPSDPNSASFAASVSQVSGNSQVGSIGTALPQLLTVKVVDAGGLPVTGANVTFIARTGGGSITPATATSNANGLVSATWTLGGTMGAQTAVALLTGSFVTDSVNFSATAGAGPAGAIVIVSGNNQTSIPGKTLPLPLVVKVTDTFGNNVSGTKITWTTGSLSGAAVPPSDTTSADGTASTSWTVGNTAMSQTLSAAVTGLPAIIFTAIVSADSTHIQITAVAAANNQVAPVSTLLPTPIGVRITDTFGNPIVGDVVTWNGAITGGGTVSAATSTTDATGTATTKWTLGGRAGAQTLVAVEGRTSLAVNFAGTATVSFSDVFAGNFMACGIAASNNQTYCWGVGDGGQLGKGTLTNATTPTTPVSTTSDTAAGPFLQVRQLSGGNDGFCALTIDRRLFCWGRTIGVSAVTTQFATAQPIVTGSSSQQILPNQISMGEQHVCILDLTGLAFCTGSDLHGELGDSSLGISPSVGTYPFVADLPSKGWAKIAAGQAHTCGIPRFDPNDASSQLPRCWGLNTSGQVGNNHTSGSGGQQVPAKVIVPAGVLFDSSTITTGAVHSCAIEAASSTTPGTAWCWGGNGSGQLGSGAVGNAIDSVPTAVVPPSGVTWARIYAGTYHTCAISTAGAAYCWGRNDYGQLGGGSALGFNTGTVTPVQVAGGLTFRSLSVGELYTCGVVGNLTSATGPSATAGTVYCWGDNLFGQIGNGTSGNNQPVLTPSKVLFQP